MKCICRRNCCCPRLHFTTLCCIHDKGKHLGWRLRETLGNREFRQIDSEGQKISITERMPKYNGASPDKIQRQGELEWLMKQENKWSFHKCAERLTQHWPHTPHPAAMVHVWVFGRACVCLCICAERDTVVWVIQQWLNQLNFGWTLKGNRRKGRKSWMHYITPRTGEHISETDRLIARDRPHLIFVFFNHPALSKLHKQPAHALYVMRTHACDPV